ncbi:hypothetical protein GJ744_007068 [Endocarpon pusillum]|uniref:Uncharacterized protein n=1 Tax=Endocarpon pusillum TaxID=364733 RepID=A0A8H7AML5_9EURO|nr:hypothetical protein GJ744_007068 [Endocarpon pusillum]
MSSTCSLPVGPSKKTAKRSTTSPEKSRPVRAQGKEKTECSSSSWTPPRISDPNLVDDATTQLPRHTSAATSSTGASQVEDNGLPVNVDTVRVQLSTAKSHLSILQILLTYDEYEGTLDEIRDRILMQQGKVKSLEQHLSDLHLKEKKKTPRRLSIQGIFSSPQRAGHLRARYQKK